MPHRALYEKRPYLFGSLIAAVAFVVLRGAQFPGLALIPIKGAAVGLLAVYAAFRHKSGDAKLIAGVMALAALGDILSEFDAYFGELAFFASVLVALALYLQPHNRREAPVTSQKLAAVSLLLGAPLAGWLLSGNLDDGFTMLALGGMAGAAWTSRFSRYHVGVGVIFLVASELLSIAGEAGSPLSQSYAWLAWPTYYVAQFLICTGVIQTLRRDHKA